jgi:hypothetical protein
VILNTSLIYFVLLIQYTRTPNKYYKFKTVVFFVTPDLDPDGTDFHLTAKMQMRQRVFSFFRLALLGLLLDYGMGNVSVVAYTSQASTISTIPLIPHHVQRQRRRHLQEDLHRDRSRRTASTSLLVAGLYQGYGTHYADLWCGTPPQRQTVIVDTGSAVTAFPCEGCDDCGASTTASTYHLDSLFRYSQSTTYHKLTCAECLRGNCGGGGGECSIGMSYQEGSSWNAFGSFCMPCLICGFVCVCLR